MSLFLTCSLFYLTVVVTSTPVWKNLSVDSWGKNALRVRFSLDGNDAYNGPGALSEKAPSMSSRLFRADDTWQSGDLTLSLNGDELSMSRGDVALANLRLSFTSPCADASLCVNSTSLTVTTASRGTQSDLPTSYYGFGEHENSRLDQAGLSYDMESCIDYDKSRGGEVCLPWVLVADQVGTSSFARRIQYGLLWNHGSYGGVDFGPIKDLQSNEMRWTGYNLDQIDIFITTFSSNATDGLTTAGAIMNAYVDATGHAPELPSWASGYWHSKNRYKTQAEVLSTYDIFQKNYSIPISVFVIDYFNWELMGDNTFNLANFPDPKSMTDTLKSGNTRLMVSTWPFSQGGSSTFKPLTEQGFAVFNGTSGVGPTDSILWPDQVCGDPCHLYDPSNPAARKWWWGTMKQGYFDYGIENFWLDAAEPENLGGPPPGSTLSIGSFERHGLLFPKYHTQAYHEGLEAAGSDGLVLARSAWAGVQKNRVVLWNGDTQSKWKYLRASLFASQNIQLSGIAWWTSDIGGYAQGKPSDPGFRELIVRWFQFGVTCPIFRQHGQRQTEPWLLGEEAFASVRKVLSMRETLRSYVEGELAETAKSGLPLNRPLWFDYPDDAAAWGVVDQVMFGRKYMTAPIYNAGQRSREVYFPGDQHDVYTHYFTNHIYLGGTSANITGSIDEWPFFSISM